MKRPNLNNRICLALAIAVGLILLFPGEQFARVGGGHSYGGGGSGGGDGGGGLFWLVFQGVRFLLYLTIEYPVIGIPLDLIVFGVVIVYFVRRGRTTTSA